MAGLEESNINYNDGKSKSSAYHLGADRYISVEWPSVRPLPYVGEGGAQRSCRTSHLTGGG